MNGVNMSDYFPIKNSYNPVVYMHKKFLPKDRKINRKTRKEDNIGRKSFVQHFQEIKNTQDKCEQFDCEKVRPEIYRTKVINNSVDKDPLIEQTIRFAKDIIPLTIPPSNNVLDTPVYYTIKPSKKTKRKHESRQQQVENDKNATFDKEKSKSAIKTEYKEKYKCIEESFSGRESVSRSSKNNTSDDVNQNKSLCCSLSESSEQKLYKKKTNDNQNIKASESFEAFATEYMNTSGDAKIKLHLMNEKDKRLLYENIRAPLVKAIKNCFSELNNRNEISSDFQYVHTAIRSNENKLDSIIDKLDRIEKILEKLGRNTTEVSGNPIVKSSKLEELGQDIVDVNDNISSEEELAVVNLSKKRRGTTTTVTSMASIRDEDKLVEDHLAKGENVLQNDDTSNSQLVKKPNQLNRTPARYCWNDGIMKK